MTNFEFYKDKILAITAKGEPIGLAKNGKPVDCRSIKCVDCKASAMNHDLKNCYATMINWLYQKHKEQPKVTKQERMFLELMRSGWVVKGKNGNVYYTMSEPMHCENLAAVSNGIRLDDCTFKLGFDKVNESSSFLYAVEDLLKLEVSEDDEPRAL